MEKREKRNKRKCTSDFIVITYFRDADWFSHFFPNISSIFRVSPNEKQFWKATTI